MTFILQPWHMLLVILAPILDFGFSILDYEAADPPPTPSSQLPAPSAYGLLPTAAEETFPRLRPRVCCESSRDLFRGVVVGRRHNENAGGHGQAADQQPHGEGIAAKPGPKEDAAQRLRKTEHRQLTGPMMAQQ